MCHLVSTWQSLPLFEIILCLCGAINWTFLLPFNKAKGVQRIFFCNWFHHNLFIGKESCNRTFHKEWIMSCIKNCCLGKMVMVNVEQDREHIICAVSNCVAFFTGFCGLFYLCIYSALISLYHFFGILKVSPVSFSESILFCLCFISKFSSVL